MALFSTSYPACILPTTQAVVAVNCKCSVSVTLSSVYLCQLNFYRLIQICGSCYQFQFLQNAGFLAGN